MTETPKAAGEEEAEAARAQANREAAMEGAEAALEKAKRVSKKPQIEKYLDTIQRRAQAEEERPQELKGRLQTEVRDAGRYRQRL